MKCMIPKYEITFSTNVKQIGIKFCHTSESKQCFHKYRFDTEIYERALGCSLPARLADLLDIASSIYLGDRLALRNHRAWFDSERRHWKRELHIIMPVRNLSFWRSPAILEQLTAVLDYVTEDKWNFVFEPLHLSNKPSQINIAFQAPQNTGVALFSGGLDAFAGVFAHLKNDRFARTYLISVVTNRRMRGVQRRQVNALKDELRLDLIHIPVPLHLKERILPDHLEEKTQRSRGFLYTVLGGVFAHLAGKDKLHLFENGVGALNLPMTDFQIGTDNTRATNPLALLDISKLLSQVLEKPFAIENLAQWSTKAEMCQAFANSSLRNAIKHTVSCDGSFSRRVRRKRQCGVCTSCLLRRQSLTAAGLAEYDFVDDYEFDVFKTSTLQNTDRLFAFHAMQNQAQKINRCLQAANPWLAFAATYPILEEMKLRLSGLSEVKMRSTQQKILRLYSAHLNEWRLFENQTN